MTRTARSPVLLALALAASLLAGCLGDGSLGWGDGPAGMLKQAGSSTVFPIAGAWAEDLHPKGVQVVVSGGGSGAGASKLCAKEIDIADMSRHMKTSEVESCRANGVEPEAWTIAFDGIVVVVNRQNDFVDSLTVAELKEIWKTGSPVKTWKDVRPAWPAEPIRLFGPDTDSGTFEYFNEEILGKRCGADGKQVCGPRADFTPSADDNVLVEGVAQTKGGLGYFGFAYYLENRDRLNGVPIQNSADSPPVGPTFESIADGSYKPLSRPLFMYTNGVPVNGTPLHAYFEHAYGDGQGVVPEIGFVALDGKTLGAMKAKL